jgi:hypothetical protein
MDLGLCPYRGSYFGSARSPENIGVNDPIGGDRRRKNPLPLKAGKWHWLAFAVIVAVLLMVWRVRHQ